MSACTNPQMRNLIHAYELNQLDDADRDQFEEHLLSCSFCQTEAQAMAGYAAVVRGHREELLDALRSDGLTFDQIRRNLRTRVTVWDRLAEFFNGWQRRTALVGALSAAILLGVLLRPDINTSQYRDLASFDLPPYQTGLTLRGDGDDEATRLFESAMTSYNDGKYAVASQGIARSLRLDAEQPERWLYMGAAQYAMMDTKAAIRSLRNAERMGSGLIKVRAQWYLAQSYLLEGKIRPAHELLESVAARGGEHAEDARVLLVRIAEQERGR